MEKINSMKLSEQFKQSLVMAIKKAGSANKLSKIVDIPTCTLLRWKNGEMSPTLESFEAMLPYLEMEVTPNSIVETAVQSESEIEKETLKKKIEELQIKNAELVGENRILEKILDRFYRKKDN